MRINAKCRLDLIEMLEYICDSLNLSDNVLHLSLNIIDFYLIPLYDYKKSPLIILLLTVIRLAGKHWLDFFLFKLHTTLSHALFFEKSKKAKVSDSDDCVPRYIELSELCDNLSSPAEFNRLEQQILKRFDWKISFPTVATFLNCFRPFVFLPEEIKANAKVLNKYGGKLDGNLNAELDKIALLVFQDREAYDYAPSLMAAACIAMVRSAFQITPIWSFQLHRVTKYSFGDMRHVNRLLRR